MDINLLPEQLRKERVKTQAVFLTNTASLVLLIFFGLAVLLSFYFRLRFLQNLNTINQEVARVESEISEKRISEGSYRALKEKIAGVDTQFKTAYSHSFLLENLGKISAGIQTTSLEVSKDKKVVVSGIAPSFSQLSGFFSQLAQQEDFINFLPSSVSKDYKTGQVSFSVEFGVK